MGGYNQ
jgi:hypothetical protein